MLPSPPAKLQLRIATRRTSGSSCTFDSTDFLRVLAREHLTFEIGAECDG